MSRGDVSLAMSITDIQRNHRKEIVRRMMLFNPDIAVSTLKERLEKSQTPIVIGLNQLHEMVKEIRAERIQHIRQETKEELYAQVADMVEWVNNQLRAIAQEEKLVYTDSEESPKARIFAQQNRTKALNSVVDNLIKLINLKMDLGIIERNLGTADFRVLDVLGALEKLRNGDYTTPLPELFARRTIGSGEKTEALVDSGQSVA